MGSSQYGNSGSRISASGVRSGTQTAMGRVMEKLQGLSARPDSGLRPFIIPDALYDNLCEELEGFKENPMYLRASPLKLRPEQQR